MTSVSRNFTHPTNIANNIPQALDNFPVGGADPDFVVVKAIKPAICAVPFLGRMFRRCQ